MTSQIDELPELASLQRRCAWTHNYRVLGTLAVTLLAGQGSALLCARFGYSPVLGLIPMALACVLGLMAVAKWDEAFSRRIGFLCPKCGQSLYSISGRFRRSDMLAQGRCPHCQHEVVRRMQDVD